MFLVLLLGVIGVVLFLIRNQYTYWERSNIPYEKPQIPFGSLDEVRRRKRSFGLIIYDIYRRRISDKLVGIYLFFRPAILIRDAGLVRQIMTTDFSSFHDRGLYSDEKNDPLNTHLFTLPGQSWKTLRAKLTPSFTSGKLKGMFGIIDDVGDKLVQHLNNVLEVKDETKTIEMKEVLTTYAIDIIGSVIFGLDVDSFSNPDNEFRRLSKLLLVEASVLERIRNIASFACPPIVKFLNLFGVKNTVMFSIRDIIQRTIDFREKNKVVRKDLLQLLIQLRNTGKISDDADDEKNWDIETAAEGLKSMSIDTIAANAFLFYIAGSETTAATAAFSLYELAMYPELLNKAQNDIAEALEKHSLKPTDKLTYEALQDMKFLDLCLMETTRKYPGLPFLNRACTQDYNVPGTNYKITKGTSIIISLMGLHRDPEYFPDPLKYDPERFSDDIRNYNPVAYMPFGEGPRHCIAQRMGKINAKVALVKILSNFNVETMERKEIVFKFDSAPVLIPKDGLNVRLSRKF